MKEGNERECDERGERERMRWKKGATENAMREGNEREREKIRWERGTRRNARGQEKPREKNDLRQENDWNVYFRSNWRGTQRIFSGKSTVVSEQIWQGDGDRIERQSRETQGKPTRKERGELWRNMGGKTQLMKWNHRVWSTYQTFPLFLFAYLSLAWTAMTPSQQVISHNSQTTLPSKYEHCANERIIIIPLGGRATLRFRQSRTIRHNPA